MSRDSDIDPKADNPGTNDEIKRAVKQQGETTPDAYPEKAKGPEENRPD
jgi:hypothetical protein